VAGDGVHIARRGNKYSAAHQLRTILRTTTDPAPCTPKPNARSGVSSRRQLPICSSSRTNAVFVVDPPKQPQ
jgi:hypothetical protein